MNAIEACWDNFQEEILTSSVWSAMVPCLSNSSNVYTALESQNDP